MLSALAYSAVNLSLRTDTTELAGVDGADGAGMVSVFWSGSLEPNALDMVRPSLRCPRRGFNELATLIRAAARRLSSVHTSHNARSRLLLR